MRDPLSFQNGALACLRREKNWGLKLITRPLANFSWMKCLLTPPLNIIQQRSNKIEWMLKQMLKPFASLV